MTDRKKKKTSPRPVSVPAKAMSSTEREFLKALLQDKSVDEASRESGLGIGAARAVLRRPEVQKIMEQEAKARDRAMAVTPAAIEAQMADIGFSDIAGLFDNEGRLKSLREIEPQDRAAISALDTTEYHDREGRLVRRIHRIKMEKRQPALHDLARMHQLIDNNRGNAIEFNISIDLGPGSQPLELGQVDITSAPSED